ncbi:hypothetical protein A7K94_0207835 [Modestobacter sp. VKM Ac-2676]|nr:hypothetical protein A7K94_0207835 [Modestobacter sp. VKM Ac-2676]
MALRGADRVITLSAESSEVSARFVPADRVELVPNAIPSSSPTEKEDLVVFGGVVSHRKGIDVLQEAWSQVDAPGWRLVVAGPVRDTALVREGIPGLTMAGSLAHEELMALLDRSRIAVLPPATRRCRCSSWRRWRGATASWPPTWAASPRCWRTAAGSSSRRVTWRPSATPCSR